MSHLLDLFTTALAVVAAALPALPVVLLFLLAYALRMKKRGLRASAVRFWGLGLLGLYLLGVALVTLVPHLTGFLFAGGQVARHASLVPLAGIAQMARLAQSGGFTTFLYNVAGNILLFVPLGLLAPLLFGPCARFGRLLLLGAGASAAIEAIQFVIGGHTDIDDLLLNTAAGALCFHPAAIKKGPPVGGPFLSSLVYTISR